MWDTNDHNPKISWGKLVIEKKKKIFIKKISVSYGIICLWNCLFLDTLEENCVWFVELG